MGWLTDLAKEVPLSAVMKERLAHEQRLHEETKVKNAELELQVKQLSEQVTALRQELGSLRVSDEFVAQGGILWKKLAAGGYDDTPYCQICKKQLVSMLANTYYCIEHKGLTSNPRKPSS